MSSVTQKFGIIHPNQLTKFKDLGSELQAFAQSVDQVLNRFDYNGADPGAHLARVVALETWRTSVIPRLAALETLAKLTASGITPTTGTSISTATDLRKRNDGLITGYLAVQRTSADFSSGATLATMPGGWRPPTSREFVAMVSTGGQSTPAAFQVLDTGAIRVWAPSVNWAGNRLLTVNVSYYAA